MKHYLAACAALCCLALAAPANAQSVGIATSNPGSLFHNIGTAVANAANKAGLQATIQPATSPNQYIPYVAQNGIQFGVANLQEVAYAAEGKEWYAPNANPDLRVVGLIMPLVEAIFVRQDSDIKSIADLKGKPMVDGYTAQNTILPQLDAMYATAGLKRSDMKSVNVPSVVAGADALISGDAVGFIFAQGAGKVREADASVGGIRALPIENTAENVAAIKKHWPVGYLVEVSPSKSAPGVKEKGYFMAYPQLVFTNAKVSDDAVYKMTKALYEGKDTMGTTFVPFKAFDPKEMVGDTGAVEYHAGAIRFYKEVGIWKE